MIKRFEMAAKLSISILLLLLICSRPCLSQDTVWQEIDKGIEVSRFKSPAALVNPDITVLRINPALWDMKLITRAQSEERFNLTAKEWCEKLNLTAAINAGMFHQDYVRHVGYLKTRDFVHDSLVNQYKSVAAFDPLMPDLPRFRMFDLDECSVDSITRTYATHVQNLRLIKRPGENRWQQQEKKWSEAALGEDSTGRILFIICRSPYSMYDLNEILLSLPIDLICAQHLEGGPEAQLYIRHNKTEIDLCGSFETGYAENDNNLQAWPIPNIIGITKKK
ncbi:MAG: phosphodiester glycosidase family protein [candidate division Zixibacteria bacterium]|nr:phosphodiester glycosidase family protein [candidate division Zixibacteria bacterium]